MDEVSRAWWNIAYVRSFFEKERSGGVLRECRDEDVSGGAFSGESGR